MTKQDFMNAIYDLIAQNPIKGAYGMTGSERDYLTNLVDYVDTERNAIVFKTEDGREFELQLVETYAPSASWRGYNLAQFQDANPDMTEEEAKNVFAKLQQQPL